MSLCMVCFHDQICEPCLRHNAPLEGQPELPLWEGDLTSHHLNRHAMTSQIASSQWDEPGNRVNRQVMTSQMTSHLTSQAV